MKKQAFLDGISIDSIRQMIPCFNPITKKYYAGETIASYSENTFSTLAILWEGAAKLELLGVDGETFFIEQYEDGAIFGELFSITLENFEYIVTATKDCTVSYIDYHHIVSPCPNACPHHSQLISNLFVMSAQKAQELSLYVSILAQPSIRAKLMAYLKYVKGTSTSTKKDFLEDDVYSNKKTEPDGSCSFMIPMSLSQLAEYLKIDRSAMMREIKLMRKDGLIESNKREFRIL